MFGAPPPVDPGPVPLIEDVKHNQFHEHSTPGGPASSAAAAASSSSAASAADQSPAAAPTAQPIVKVSALIASMAPVTYFSEDPIENLQIRVTLKRKVAASRSQ